MSFPPNATAIVRIDRLPPTAELVVAREGGVGAATACFTARADLFGINLSDLVYIITPLLEYLTLIPTQCCNPCLGLEDMVGEPRESNASCLAAELATSGMEPRRLSLKGKKRQIDAWAITELSRL